jgi:hypothetical protein
MGQALTEHTDPVLIEDFVQPHLDRAVEHPLAIEDRQARAWLVDAHAEVCKSPRTAQ